MVISTLSLKILVRLKNKPGKEINEFRIRPPADLLKYAKKYKKGQYYQPPLWENLFSMVANS